MKGKKKQSLIMKLMLSPMRILKRARQLYMKGLEDCAGQIGYGGLATFPISHHHHHLLHHQRFLEVKPLRARFGGGAGDTTIEQQIPRKVHITYVKNAEAENQTRQLKQARVKHNIGMIRKMARIDEDQPCNFEEDQIDIKTIKRNLVLCYPRR